MQVQLQNETDRLRDERLRMEEERQQLEAVMEQRRLQEEERKQHEEQMELLRIEAEEQRKIEAERRKQEEEKRKEEAEATAKSLQAELEELVSSAEFLTKGVSERSATLDANTDDDDVIRTCEELESEMIDARAALKMCQEFMGLKHLGLIGASEETRKNAQKFRMRVQDMNRLVERETTKVGARKKKAIQSKEAEARRIAAVKAEEKQQHLFKHYDVDSDEKLNALEMMEFVKGEYDFEFPLEKAESILKQDAFAGLGGVPYSKFPHLKMLIGIARNEALAKKRKIEKEEKDKAEAEEKERRQKLAIEQTAQVLAGVKIVETAMSGIEGEVARAEEKGRPLAFSRGRQQLPLGMIEERADEVDVAVDAARDFLAAAKEQASSMAGVPNDKLEPSVIPGCAPARQLFFRLDYMEKRLQAVTKTAQAARDRVILAQKKADLMRQASEAAAAAQAAIMSRQPPQMPGMMPGAPGMMPMAPGMVPFGMPMGMTAPGMQPAGLAGAPAPGLLPPGQAPGMPTQGVPPPSLPAPTSAAVPPVAPLGLPSGMLGSTDSAVAAPESAVPALAESAVPASPAPVAPSELVASPVVASVEATAAPVAPAAPAATATTEVGAAVPPGPPPGLPPGVLPLESKVLATAAVPPGPPPGLPPGVLPESAVPAAVPAASAAPAASEVTAPQDAPATP